MIGLPTWTAWGSASGLSYRLKSFPLAFWSAGVCKMVWFLAGQTYLITCWEVRRWTKGAVAVSAHPCSYRRLIILRSVRCGHFLVFWFRTTWTVFSLSLVLLPAMEDSCAWDVLNNQAIFTASSCVREDPLLIIYSLTLVVWVCEIAVLGHQG